MKKIHADLTHDLILPTLLFAAIGAMTWAVRGCSGYGASAGCAFAGVTWGAAWWFIARDPRGAQSRRYASGWIILAFTIGMGVAGARGWMQWPSFFEGKLMTNAPNAFVPISPVYGFVWLFIAGAPWAGLAACTVAWCGTSRPMRLEDWGARIACGVVMALLGRYLFARFPEVFLPLYKSLQAQYHDFDANPTLRRLVNDNQAAITHLGLYLGFLMYEMGRREWKNVILISAVGLLNGAGWAMCQNWKWAPVIWSNPNEQFNWWRCWESSGGISIGVAFGIAYFLVNRRQTPPETKLDEPAAAFEGRGEPYPNWERFAVYFGVLFGLGMSIRNGLKGWANIHIGNEEYWSGILSMIIVPILVAGTIALIARIRYRPLPRGYREDVIPSAYGLMWLVLITQNILAQLVTGPYTAWSEMSFKMYYGLLFCITAVIICHYQYVKRTEFGWK